MVIIKIENQRLHQIRLDSFRPLLVDIQSINRFLFLLFYFEVIIINYRHFFFLLNVYFSHHNNCILLLQFKQVWKNRSQKKGFLSFDDLDYKSYGKHKHTHTQPDTLEYYFIIYRISHTHTVLMVNNNYF